MKSNLTASTREQVTASDAISAQVSDVAGVLHPSQVTIANVPRQAEELNSTAGRLRELIGNSRFNR